MKLLHNKVKDLKYLKRKYQVLKKITSYFKKYLPSPCIRMHLGEERPSVKKYNKYNLFEPILLITINNFKHISFEVIHSNSVESPN